MKMKRQTYPNITFCANGDKPFSVGFQYKNQICKVTLKNAVDNLKVGIAFSNILKLSGVENKCEIIKAFTFKDKCKILKSISRK